MKKISLILTAFLISLGVTAQTVNFSGTWKLNTEKSKLGVEFSMAPTQIIIIQNGNEFNVERLSNFQGEDFTSKDKFTLDGKECINTGWRDSEKKSTVTVSDDKQSFKCITKITMEDGGEMTITETYKMDNGNMVVESLASSDFGDMPETQVYEKQ
jgi:hypothetical protein